MTEIDWKRLKTIFSSNFPLENIVYSGDRALTLTTWKWACEPENTKRAELNSKLQKIYRHKPIQSSVRSEKSNSERGARSFANATMFDFQIIDWMDSGVRAGWLADCAWMPQSAVTHSSTYFQVFRLSLTVMQSFANSICSSLIAIFKCL